MNIIPVSGCAIAKMAGLPTGLAWDAKKRTFTGYPTKSGTYTVTITAARKVGKKITSKISTITVVVDPMPAGLAGTFNGHTRPYHLAEDGEYPEGYIPPAWEMFQLNKTSKPVTLTVASNGKLTAKVGTSAFSGGGLTAEAMASGNRYWAEFRKTTTTKVNKKLTRTRKERLLVTIDPFADRFGSAFDISESEYAYTETLGSARATISPDTRVFGRLNKFGKDANGRVKDADWSAIANLAAAGGEKTLYMWRHAADGGRYRFTSSPTENPGDATNEYVPVTAFVDGPNGPYSAQATLKVSVNAETGVATLAGASDDGKPINGTAVLSPEVENVSGVEQCSAYARFFAGKFVIEIKFPLLPGPASGVFAGVGDLSGQGWESGK